MHLLPDVPHVACFDSAFHSTMPEVAWRYPVPTSWSEWGVRKYGFHGLSVDWSVREAAHLLDRPPSGAIGRRRPPRQRLFGDRGSGRPFDMDVDGLHPSRGPDDGHPFRFDRSGAAAVPAPFRAPAARGAGRGARERLGPARRFGLFGRTCASCTRRRIVATRGPSSPSRCSWRAPRRQSPPR